MGESKERRPRGRRKVRFEEVLPSSDLPPLVQGDLRCFLIVDIGKINWSSTATALVPPVSPAYVRLRWWGETSEGTLFKPACTKSGKPVKSRARFGVRSGTKQMSAYFVDMGSIILEMLTSPKSVPLGHIQIPRVSSLTSENPIRGYFPIISPTSRKIGELQINVRFQTLEGAYDLSTDTGTDTSVSSRSRPSSEIGRRSHSRGSSVSSVKSNTGSRAHVGSARSRSSSAGSRKGSRGRKRSSSRTKIRGRSRSTESNASSVSSRKSSRMRSKVARPKEHDIPQGVDDILRMNGHDLYSVDDNCSKKSTTSSQRKPKMTDNDESSVKSDLDKNGGDDDDAITALLKKGNRLRGDMMKTQVETTSTTYEVLQQMKNREVELQQQQIDALHLTKDQTSASLHPYKTSLHPPPALDLPKVFPPVKQHKNDLDMRFVDLVFGSQEFRGHPAHLSCSDSTLGSPMSSLISDFEDNPLCDPALLQQLFYTNGTSTVDLVKVNERLREIENLEQEENNSNVIKSLVSYEASSRNKEFVKKLANRVRGFTEKKMQTLSKVRYVQVHVGTLSLTQQDISSSQSKRRSKKGHGKSSKPPMPSPKGKKRTGTFFVEYRFPFVDAQKREHPSSMATSHEVTRVASRKSLNQAGTLIEFNEETEFAMRFTEAAILAWCNNNLEFVVHLRRPADKKPFPLGVATLPLTSVIESQCLSFNGDLEILNETKYCGNLQTSINFIPNDLVLSSPSRDLTSQSFMHERSLQDENDITYREPELPCKDTESIETAENNIIQHEHKMAPERQDSSIAISPSTSVLHMMLMIPDGFNIPGTSVISSVHGTTSHPPNVYLVCRTLASGHNQQTPVVWGESNPKFDFVQISPVKLDTSLLSRMQNNFLVVEVWTKITTSTPHTDKLLGLVKLSTHHFYQSLKDEEISRVVLNSQHPLISTDESMSVVDVFTGQERGKLNVTLALGTQEQILNLKKIKGDLFERRQHHLEDGNINETDHQRAPEGPVEHVFEINVVRLNGFKPFSDQVWGETDCFVQYQFPTLMQCEDSGTGGSREQSEHNKNLDLASMQFYRSDATLCVPDPSFNDARRHIFCPPSSVPVQRILLSCCYGDGFSGAVPFELWSRRYHPNVRDQLLAKGSLPVAKIGSLVTMTSQKISEQTFNVPLQFVDLEQSTSEPAGILEVRVKYRVSGTTLEGSQLPMQFRKPIILRVGLMRACGLKAAATLASRHSNNSNLEYCADVGVNTYVQIRPTFLPDEESRTSQLVAQSFAPDYQHHFELACPLVSYHRDITPTSLAELIVSGEIEFTVWHRPENGCQSSTSDDSNDLLLAEVTVPTRTLLRNITGAKSWFLLKPPERFQGRDDTSRTVGALEISMTFAHSNDLDLMLRAAKATGWSLPPYESRHMRNDDVSDDITKTEHTTFSITVTNAWLPNRDLMLHGRTSIDKNACAYIRYKFFDHDSMTSSLCPLVAKQPSSIDARFENLTSARIAHKKSFVCKRSRPLAWFLREETLEVQVWLTHSRASKKSRPLDSDKMLGSIYVDLGTLGDMGNEQHISGSFEVVRPGCDDLGGGKLRVYVSMKPGVISDPIPDPTPEFRLQSDSASELDENIEIVAQEKADEPEQQLQENCFFAVVTIERAMHLPLVGNAETSEHVKPNCFVSYEVLQNVATGGAKDDERPKVSMTTRIVTKSLCPVWNDESETELPPALLTGSNGAFLIKVWHRDGLYLTDRESVGGDGDENLRETNVTASDRMLGFASVDLSVLRAGFRDVNGWYNILDIHGNCQGQLKVAVTPTKLPDLGKSPPRSKEQRSNQSGVVNFFSRAPVKIPVQTPSGSLYYPGIPNSAQTVRTTCELEESAEKCLPRRYDNSRNTQGTSERENLTWGQSSDPSSRVLLSNYGNLDRQQLCLVTTLKKQMEELEQIKKKFEERKMKGFVENDEHDVQTQKNSTHAGRHNAPGENSCLYEVQSQKSSSVVSNGLNMQTVECTTVSAGGKNKETVLNLRPNWTDSFAALPDMNILSRTDIGDQTRVPATGNDLQTDVCKLPTFLNATTQPKSVHLSLFEHPKVNQGHEFDERAMSDNEVSSDIEFVHPRNLNDNLDEKNVSATIVCDPETIATHDVTERRYKQQEQPVISAVTPGRSEGHSVLEDTSLWLSESTLQVSEESSDDGGGGCSQEEDDLKEVEVEDIKDIQDEMPDLGKKQATHEQIRDDEAENIQDDRDEMTDLANMQDDHEQMQDRGSIQDVHDQTKTNVPDGINSLEQEDVDTQQDACVSRQEGDDQEYTLEEDDQKDNANKNVQDPSENYDDDLKIRRETTVSTSKQDNHKVLEDIESEDGSSSDTQDEDLYPALHDEHLKEDSQMQVDIEEDVDNKRKDSECKRQQAKVTNDTGRGSKVFSEVNNITTCMENKLSDSEEEEEDFSAETALHPRGRPVESYPRQHIEKPTSKCSHHRVRNENRYPVKHDTRSFTIPSFFPPTRNLEASMRALQEATLHHEHKLMRSKQESEDLSKPGDASIGHSLVDAVAAEAMQQKVRRIPPKPSIEQTKRLARIFGTKFS